MTNLWPRSSVAFDGNAGLDLTETYRFDLIVLHVMLPGMNGWDFTRRLRGAQRTVPILMLTACDTSSDVVQGLAQTTTSQNRSPSMFCSRVFEPWRADRQRQTPLY